jgi:phosphoribosyl 1,2-cyclic phosphodiesterase
MQVRFWGVRGSIAVSGPRYTDTGGNTPCVEIVHDGERLVLDGGTGLRALGDHLGFGPQKLRLVFSHVHWDHIQGVPFFGPAFHPESEVEMIGVPRSSGSLRDALHRQMKPPQFPITLDMLRARMAWRDLRDGQAFETGPFRVTPLELHHPDGGVAWRIEAGGRSMVYATDHEHGGRGVMRSLVALSEGVDLLVHDAQYTAPEYRGEAGPPRVGWGHSTWEEAVETGRQAQVARLALFHHDPGRGDREVTRIETLARQRLPCAFAAREGERMAL